MQPQPPAPRSLRVTLLLDGTVAGERFLPLDAQVTIGPRPGDSFSIPHLSETVALTAVDDKGTHLLLAGITGGTLARPAGQTDLGRLWRPDGRLLLLPDDQVTAELASGVAARLQLSAQPSEAALMPGRFRPRVFDEGSALWLSSLAFWSAVATALLVFVLQQEPRTDVDVDDIPDRVVDIMLNMPTDDSTPPETAPTPQSAPRTLEDVLSDPSGDGLSWGRSGLARRSEVIRRLIEADIDLFRIDRNAPMDQQVRDALARELSSYDDQLDDSMGGPRGLSGGPGSGDARIGPLERLGADTPVVALANRTGTVDERVALPDPEVSLASMFSREDTMQRRGPPSEVIRSAMKLYRRQVRHCFEMAKRSDPNLSGRVTLELDIAGGKVEQARISESTARSEYLSTCLTRRASRWSFPEDIDELIELPFSFN